MSASCCSKFVSLSFFCRYQDVASLHKAPDRESWTLPRGLTGIVRPHLGKTDAVTGYGYALDPLRSVGVGEKNEGQGVIPRPFMCVGSFACLTAGASGGRERSGWLWLRR